MAEAGWFPDPLGRFDQRYFDGSQWTAHVTLGDRQVVDPEGIAQSSSPSTSSADAGESGVTMAMQAPPIVNVGQPQRPTGNGMAVAALVLGIIGAVTGLIPLFFFLAFICGGLALVFGLVAWRAVKKKHAPRKGMAIAGTVLGIVAVGLGVIGVVIIDDAVDELDSAFDEAFGAVESDEYSIEIERCSTDSLGFAEAEGTITNTSDRTFSAMVNVYFLIEGDVRAGDGVEFLSDLAPGQTARWSANSLEQIEQPFRCETLVE